MSRLTIGAAAMNVADAVSGVDPYRESAVSNHPTLGPMESLQPVIALILGLVLGGGVATLVLIALRARDRARVAASTALPDGTAAVLQGMDEVAVVVDTSLQIVAVSAPAELFGMHEDYALPGDELRALARTVRRTEAPETQTMRLKRGVEPRLVSARARVITPRRILIVIRGITER
jgi:two-component system sensor histidine kinase SenX3